MQKFACRGQISAFLLSFCDTFHLNQPSWPADFGFYDDAGYLRIKLLHHSIYRMIVGNISQVDDEVLDIIHGGIAIFQQGSYVLQQSAGLSYNIFFINYVSQFVDARRA